MIATLLVNKVRPDSYTKDGTTYETLDLVCMDRGDGQRVDHAIVFSVDKTQRERLQNVDLRDRSLQLDVTEVGTNYKGEVRFRGLVLDIDKLTGGKLTVEKPGKTLDAVERNPKGV